MKKITALLIITISFSACFHNYYKVKKNDQWNEDQLQELQKSEKKLIVHFVNGIKEMINPVFKEEQITGVIKEYSLVSNRYIEPDTAVKANFKYKFRHRKELFSEIHIYVNQGYAGQKEFTISKENFTASYFNSPNRGLSVASHVLGVVIILGILAAAGAITVSTISFSYVFAFPANCPQAYIETTAGQYQFIGGLFTGAVRQDLQRTDMIKLSELSNSDTLRLQIRGMKDEIQFLDHVSVKQIVHPEGTEIAGNQYGDLFIIRYLKMPNEVKVGNAVDRSKSVLFRDGQSYGFHITDSLANNGQLQLRFSRKEGDKKAVLVACMKNSIWSGYINHQIDAAQTNPLTTQASYHSAMNSAAMKISILTKNGWKLADYFPPAGNTASRNLAMELDLSEVEGKEVFVRMEAPYRFWDIDQAGLCYETVRPSDVIDLNNLAATKNKVDQAKVISSEDHQYLSLESNDQLNLEYIKPPKTKGPGNMITYMLVAGGYYRQRSGIVLPQAGQPLRMTDNLNHYSIARYKELGLSH